MKIKTFVGGYDDNISYLVWCESTGIAGVIDASVEPVQILEYIEKQNLILEKIFITHSHFDHIRYIDQIMIQYPFLQLCGYYKSEEEFSKNYRGLIHHQIIALGSDLITIIHTPGHYPDSICLWHKKNRLLFTGDTMFVGRTGRTIGPKSSISELYLSIYNEILKLPMQTQILPGHHYGFKKSISLKDNIRLSSFFQCESLLEFTRVMEKFEENR